MQDQQPTPTSRPPVLVVTAGPAPGSRVTIPPEGLLIGRSGDPQEQLGKDPALSRQHARLTRWPGGVLVEDLGSTNGTFVNGTRVHSQTIHTGDVVTIGETELQVVDDGNAHRPGPSQPARTALLAISTPRDQLQTPPPSGGRPPGRQQPPMPAPASSSRRAPSVPPPLAPPAVPSPAVRPLPNQAGTSRGGPPTPARSRAPLAVPPPSPGSIAQPGAHFATLVNNRPSMVAHLGRYLGPFLRTYLIIAGLAFLCALGSAVAKHYLGSRVPAEAMPGYWAGRLIAALALASAAVAVVKTVKVYSMRFVLDRGVLQIEQGTFERRATRIDLGRVRTVQLRQTLLQRLSEDGTLAIHLMGEAKPLLVTGLARGNQLQQIYQELTNPASRLRQRQS